MNKLDGQSMDLVKENVEKLKELFPSIVKEDKIDFEELELLLGENINRNNEQYSFTWNGKTEATKLAQKRSTGTLRPCKEESKDWDNTQNLYIEGDNLEVLRLLQASYNGRIKMIYIDPPYNTGHDFVYKDNFEDNIKNYKEQTGQAAKSNADTDGRYHTNWLNMMYPRLKLARNLLTDDGVIFISIDDNEQANLKKICDEVFGENNFVGEIIRKTKSMTGDNGCGFNLQHESLFIYSKNMAELRMRGSEKNFAGYNNPDNDINGDWCSADPSAKSGGSSTYFEIINPYTGKIDLPPKGRYWAFSKDTLKKYIESGKIIFKKQHKNEERGFIFKRYKKDALSAFNPLNSLFIDNFYMNQSATTELNNLFENSYFSYPKPVKYILDLINSSTSQNDIILDFFSGSATTAHAVMQLNAEDGGNRKFIMVQLPELTDENSEAHKVGYKNICEIGKERIRRAGKKIENLDGLDGAIIAHRLIGKDKLTEKDVEEFKKSETYQQYLKDLDTGFKVFKLDSSNLKKWDNTPTKDIDTIKERIQTSMDYLKDDRNELDLVYEVMLKYGIDLSYPVRKTGNEKAYIVEAPEYKLLVCTMPNISLDDVESFANENVGTYLFADRCFGSDSLLINTEEILKSRNKEMRLF